MVQGLQTKDLQDAAHKWLDEKFELARKLAQGEWKMPDPDPGKKYTPDDEKNKKDQAIADSVFYAQVKGAVDRIDTNKPDHEKLLKAELQKLKDKEFETMKIGVPPKGMGAILMESFQSFGNDVYNGIHFDIWHPLDSLSSIPTAIMGALWSSASKFIKDTALSYATEGTAAWMKAFKHNYLDYYATMASDYFKSESEKELKNFKPMTTEEAAKNLAFQNAAEALAKERKIPDNELKGFVGMVVAQIETPAAPKPEENKATGKAVSNKATEKLSEEKSANANEKGAEKSAEKGKGNEEKPILPPIKYHIPGFLGFIGYDFTHVFANSPPLSTPKPLTLDKEKPGKAK